MNESSNECVMDPLVLLYRIAEEKASEWQKALRHAEKEAGRVMRLERKKRGLTLRKMAKAMGVSAPHLHDMECGNRRYSVSWIQEAEKIFKQNPQIRSGK
jgi:ribosome-binding protein aMBF1 (putative translation factor)